MFYKLTRALFCSFVAVNCLSSIENYALDKIKDPEYMKTQYQYSTENDTREVALDHIYAGGSIDEGEISREAAQEGFLIWKRDAGYLSSEDFRQKLLSPNTFDECVTDFDLWCDVTSVADIFYSSWNKDDGIAAISRLEEMCEIYEKWLKDGACPIDFTSSSVSHIKSILDRTKEGHPYQIIFFKK